MLGHNSNPGLCMIPSPACPWHRLAALGSRTLRGGAPVGAPPAPPSHLQWRSGSGSSFWWDLTKKFMWSHELCNIFQEPATAALLVLPHNSVKDGWGVEGLRWHSSCGVAGSHFASGGKRGCTTPEWPCFCLTGRGGEKPDSGQILN